MLAEALPPASMDLLVHEQAAEPRKGLVTLVAAMRPLPRVRVHVITEQIGQSKAFFTQFTLMWFVSIM